ncbi:uroporphyrinogen-III C-methyltransferase [Shouchella lehensis]|uniref:Uroporphyrinogen-III C-methyltransferase n=1 Tax=Shouchella lehensis TaxID=300825 RepID=A0A4Y7WMM9_9BACI|nr:uroporphyrinogen-III C-methyltransferase [Shouchella lehensis]TES49798.1 uroporphyrinogen-III C-methyltransferase [Shouchella lehensis]
MSRGTVYLIGAGPGDIGLISYKGMQRLRQADVVLYDRLVNPLLLEEVKEGAELIYVGKLPNRHILRQEAIHDELVRQADHHQTVVRLKGGDPSVFGRVGEEAAFLDRYQVPFEIIPGITSGIAVPAYANVPVTHRTKGTSFAVATGHSQKENSLELDWSGLAKIDTVAFYMGVKNLPRIVENFIQHGRPESESVLCIQWGTTSKQKVVKATLATIVEEVNSHGIGNPAITLVGKVAELYKGKSWFEDQPLFGHYPLVLAEGSSSLVSDLRQAGAEAFAPKVALQKDENSVLFYSSDDVEVFIEQLREEAVDIRTISLDLVAVTSSAQNALKHYGLLAAPLERKTEDESTLSNLDEKWTTATNVILGRLQEEQSITDIILSSSQRLPHLFRIVEQYPELREVPIYSDQEEVVKTLCTLGFLGVRVSGQTPSVLGQWLHARQGKVMNDASYSLRRSWQPSPNW